METLHVKLFCNYKPREESTVKDEINLRECMNFRFYFIFFSVDVHKMQKRKFSGKVFERS